MIEWAAAVRVEVENVALPLVLSVAVPSAVVPSLKVTVPLLGVPVLGASAVTVAVMVTD